MSDRMTIHVTADSELVERARELLPLLDEHAAADATGTLAEPVVQALHEGGFFGMWVPRSVGGSELGPLQSLKVIEELTYGDRRSAGCRWRAGWPSRQGRRS